MLQVDFEESKSQNRFVVKQGVDEELDRSESCMTVYRVMGEEIIVAAITLKSQTTTLLTNE